LAQRVLALTPSAGPFCDENDRADESGQRALKPQQRRASAPFSNERQILLAGDPVRDLRPCFPHRVACTGEACALPIVERKISGDGSDASVTKTKEVLGCEMNGLFAIDRH
jgi:hypothetical protein